MITRFTISLGNEIRKGLLFAWSERLQILIEMPAFVVLLLLLGPLLDSDLQIEHGRLQWSLTSGRTSVLVLWFIPFLFLYMQSVKLFWRLLAEIQTGTLEQVYLSPLPSWLVAAAGRVVAALIETIFVAGVTYGIVSAIVPLHYYWSASALVPVALLAITGIGYSLIIGGLTLVWKRVQMVQESLLALVVLFSASAVPLISVPRWWADTGRAFPATSAIASLYRVLLARRSVTELWGVGGLIPLLITTAVYLAAGIGVFHAGERIAKRRGSLARY